MEFGQNGELPEEARGEDLTTVAGRLRAAMMRAGKRAHYTVLKQMIDETLPGDTEINKQTVHNWFKPTCKFIDQAWLFKVAKLLDVSPEWLGTGDGNVAAPRTLSDDYEQAVGMWKSLPDDKARTAWIKSGHSIMDLLGQRSKEVPYQQAPEPVTTKRR